MQHDSAANAGLHHNHDRVMNLKCKRSWFSCCHSCLSTSQRGIKGHRHLLILLAAREVCILPLEPAVTFTEDYFM